MWEQNVTEIFVFLKKRIKEEEEEGEEEIYTWPYILKLH